MRACRGEPGDVGREVVGAEGEGRELDDTAGAFAGRGPRSRRRSRPGAAEDRGADRVARGARGRGRVVVREADDLDVRAAEGEERVARADGGMDPAARRRQAERAGQLAGGRLRVARDEEEMVDLDDHGLGPACRLRMAEGVGFEPTRREALRFSRPLRSTTPAPLRERSPRRGRYRSGTPSGPPMRTTPGARTGPGHGRAAAAVTRPSRDGARM